MTSEQIRSLSTEELRRIVNGMDLINTDRFTRFVAQSEIEARRK